jgi:hypothetical protein
MTAGVPLIETTKELIDALLDSNISYDTISIMINQHIKMNGFSLSIVMKELVSYILKNNIHNIHPNKLATILCDLSDLENRVSS